MQGKCIYQFNPEVKARATAWQLRRLQIHGGANCTIYQFYQEGKQEKPAGNVIDLDFGMQSVFHLHLLLFLRNSLCFWLSKADRFIWLFYFNFCLFLQVFSQSSFLFFYFSRRAKQICAVNNTSCRFLRSDAGKGEKKRLPRSWRSSLCSISAETPEKKSLKTLPNSDMK